jgi:hypothetical protein
MAIENFPLRIAQAKVRLGLKMNQAFESSVQMQLIRQAFITGRNIWPSVPCWPGRASHFYWGKSTVELLILLIMKVPVSVFLEPP